MIVKVHEIQLIISFFKKMLNWVGRCNKSLNVWDSVSIAIKYTPPPKKNPPRALAPVRIRLKMSSVTLACHIRRLNGRVFACNPCPPPPSFQNKWRSGSQQVWHNQNPTVLLVKSDDKGYKCRLTGKSHVSLANEIFSGVTLNNLQWFLKHFLSHKPSLYDWNTADTAWNPK